MLNYVKPSIVDCGNSAVVIKGECGWGGEGWTLDKTGAKKNKTIKAWGAPFVCPGPGVINTCRRCEIKTNQCSTKSNQCG